jgi:uncharacterized protein YegP (UPF0339 family)
MKKPSEIKTLRGNMMLAGFEYFQSDRDAQWYFQLKAPNGGILMQSGSYLSEHECLEGIDMVRRYADVAIIECASSIRL